MRCPLARDCHQAVGYRRARGRTVGPTPALAKAPAHADMPARAARAPAEAPTAAHRRPPHTRPTTKDSTVIQWQNFSFHLTAPRCHARCRERRSLIARARSPASGLGHEPCRDINLTPARASLLKGPWNLPQRPVHHFCFYPAGRPAGWESCKWAQHKPEARDQSNLNPEPRACQRPCDARIRRITSAIFS